MEGTYAIESFPFVSQSFKVCDFFKEYTKYLSDTIYSKQGLATKTDDLEKIACLMGIELDECKELEQLCSLSLLDTKQEEILIIPPGQAPLNPEDALLEKATRTLVTAVELKAAKSRPLRYARKLRDLKKTLVPEFPAEPIPSPVMSIPTNFVVFARVFRPFNCFSSAQSVPHAQDFMLLGSQSLISFRERITCVNDEVVVGDSVREENTEAHVPMKRLFTSGMFFFGNTFYCDLRDMMSKDYGEVVDRWAKANPHLNLGPFEHRSMEEATISDLEIRLGFPYVYMHLGTCEHLITFVDARLMSPCDVQDLARYPLIVETESSLMYCLACDTHSTSWIVEDDSMPTKPANLCKQCYDMYYTRNGKHVPPAFCCIIPEGSHSSKPPN